MTLDTNAAPVYAGIPLDVDALTHEHAGAIQAECAAAFAALHNAAIDVARALRLDRLDQERDDALIELIDGWSDLDRRASSEIDAAPDRQAALCAIDACHKRGRELIDVTIDRFNAAPPAPNLTKPLNGFSQLVAMIEDRRSERIAELCGLAPATLH